MMNKFFAVLAAVSFSGAAFAAPTAWTGANSSFWSDGGNWSGAAQPVNGDGLYFLVNPANQPSQNDLTSFAPASITFSNAAVLTLGGNSFGLGYSTNVQAVSLGRGGTAATGTTAAAHGLLAGQMANITGAGAPFDGNFLITIPNATQFTFAVANSGVTNTTGSAVPTPMVLNQNVTTGRNVTLGNELSVVPTQYWSSVSANGVMIFAGNLTGGGNIFYNNPDTRTVTPAFRLAGTNSGFTGNFVPVVSGNSGLMLLHPAAMTAGNIDLGGNDRNLWIQGGAGVGTYTFGLGGGTNAVNFRNAGQGGLKVSGGGVSWDPGNGGDYSTVGIASPRVRVARGLATETNTLVIGNGASRLVLSTNGFAFGYADSGTGPLIVRMDFALGDDGFARQFVVGEGGNSFGGLFMLTRAASGGNLGGKTIIDIGMNLAVTNMDQLFTGNLDIRSGTLLLDGVSWADFAANRSAGNGTNVLQWQLNGGGFSARGAPLVIPNDTSGGLSDSSFNRNFTLGSAVLDASGAFYANQPVTLARDTIITTQRTITIGGTGPGISGSLASGIVHAISANLSGVGVPDFTGAASANLNAVSEVVLSGTNTWTGSSANAINTGNFLNTGAGGLRVGVGYVVFENDAALPTGNGGNPAFIAAVARNTTSFGYGFLLRGGVTENVFDLAPNSRFMLGSMSTSQNSGLFGATPGRSKLQNSSILVHDGLDSFGGGLPMMFLMRSNAVLKLGDTTNGAVRIIPSRGQDAVSTNVATPALTATNSRVLVKRGEGTLVLENVSYTDVAETGNTAAQFIWQIGRGTGGNSGNAAYSDGAVRGLSPNDPAASTSNSLAGFWISLRGGVYEIDNSGGGSGTFNRWVSINPAATNISIGNISGTTGLGGGGFAAFGGDVVVDLNTNGMREVFRWLLANTGFVQGGDPLMFGSQTANRTIEFFDSIDLNAGQREIRVLDNTNSTSDKAVISGQLIGVGASALLKTGGGILELRGSNTYSAGTSVSAGTLLVNNTNGFGTGTGVVAVASGATLGGSGIIGGSLVSTGAVSPGASLGLLTVRRDYTQIGSLNIELGGTNAPGTDYDVLAVSSNANLNGALNVSLTNAYAPANGDALTILTAANVNGTFATTNLPVLAGSNQWVVEYLPNAVVLSVTNTGGGGPPPPTGYDLYATQITNGLTGIQNDADGDGYVNLLEYVTGANPTNADQQARMGATKTGGGAFALVFARATNSVDATLIVEGSDTATNNAVWTGFATNIAGSWGSATNVTESGAGSPVLVTARDIVPAATSRYLRLRVTRP